jgi:sugar lactone lactonase YvrE
MREYSTEVLFRPETEQLRFLPEGPYPYSDDRLSWVAIQHGADAKTGSLNLFDFDSRSNQSIALPGRPGFAFPTNRDSVFVIGMERQVGLFDTGNSSFKPLGDPIESGVTGTVINDGVVFSGGLIFGCKDLKFAEAKAGLYLWRRSDWQTIRLRSDQTCSNGKVVFGDGERVTLLDIDTPTKTVVRYELDVTDARLSPPEVVVDLRKGDVYPDGMIATPDGASVIIAFYNPADAAFGEAKQFSLATGEVEAVWRTENSPRVTCPQLVERDGQIKLILTTADEGMTPEQQAIHTNAGALFIGDTEFTSLPETPLFDIPQ